MALHALDLQLLAVGADVSDNQAAIVGDLAAEPELNCEDLGLTDTLLGDGQYGQTLLVRSCSHSVGDVCYGMCVMPLAKAICLYSAANLSSVKDQILHLTMVTFVGALNC